MKIKNFVPAILFGLLAVACAGPDSHREELINEGWKFLRADAENGQDPDFDDSSWRIVDLPHDYSIEDLPEAESESDGE